MASRRRISQCFHAAGRGKSGTDLRAALVIRQFSSTVDRLPCAVGLAASGAVGLFSAATDGDDSLIFAAILAGIGLVGPHRRHFIAVSARRIFPVNRLVRGNIFENIADAGLIARVDRAAEHAAKQRAYEGSADDGTGAPALIRAYDTAQHRADDRTDSIAVARGTTVAVTVAIVVAIDGVVTRIWPAVVVVIIADNGLDIDGLRDRHDVMDVPIHDDWPAAPRMMLAVIAVPRAVVVDGLVGPTVLGMVVATTVAVPLIVPVIVVPVARIPAIAALPVDGAAMGLPSEFRLLNLALLNHPMLLSALIIKLNLLLTLPLSKCLLLLMLTRILFRLVLITLALLQDLLLTLTIPQCLLLSLLSLLLLTVPFANLFLALALLHGLLMLPFVTRLRLPVLWSLPLLNALRRARLFGPVALDGTLPFLLSCRVRPGSAIARGRPMVLIIPWRGDSRNRQPATKSQHDSQSRPSHSAPHHRVPPQLERTPFRAQPRASNLNGS